MNYRLDCSRNITELTDEDFIALFELYLYNETNFDPLSVTILKPNSYEVTVSIILSIVINFNLILIKPFASYVFFTCATFVIF